MPILKSGEARIHYALEGQSGTPVLVFSNSLGTNYSMWDPQFPEFRKKFRVLRYDTRGHGQSSLTPGPYSIEQLGKDVVALLDALDLDHVHFCGLSMGGMIGIWLGVNEHWRQDWNCSDLECPHRCGSKKRHEVGRFRSSRAMVYAPLPPKGASDDSKYSENARGNKPGWLRGVLRRRSRFRFPRSTKQNSHIGACDFWSARSGYAPCGRTLSLTTDSRCAIC